MDTQRDFGRFKTLIARLCSTMGQFCTDELVESWWKALRHVDYSVIEGNVDRFLGRADESTKFPRPAQMRPKDQVPNDPGQVVGNPIRDYWRSCVVNDVGRAMGYGGEMQAFERLIIRNASSLGQEILCLIGQMEEYERTSGRTAGLHVSCLRLSRDIAIRYTQSKAA